MRLRAFRDAEQTELGAHDAEFDDRKGTRHPLENHACDECDSRCNLEAGQSFQYRVVRRPFWVVELGSKVDATRGVAVVANGLLAVQMAKAVGENTVDCAAK